MLSDGSLIVTDRASAELLAGRPILIKGDHGRAVYVPAEVVGDDDLRWLRRMCGGRLHLVITPQRAAAIGTRPVAPEDAAVAIPIPAGASASAVRAMAAADYPTSLIDGGATEWKPQEGDDSGDPAVVRLLKVARMLPAAVKAPLSVNHDEHDAAAAIPPTMFACRTSELLAAGAHMAASVRRVAEATIPLFHTDDTRFVSYRSLIGNREHVAILIDRPDLTQPVPVRMHSACLTGDLFASLRCDCGDQLRGAAETLMALGGGVLLYLAEEGRGIGLSNKLRAYQLQDGGHDTIDADALLGFAADERDFEVAAKILKDLGIRALRLLTNNPDKISALEANGVRVVDRIPLTGRTTRHNHRYLRAKQVRASHLLDVDELMP